MRNIPLLTFILFGDFGLFTAVPKYLFLVLLPVMMFIGIFGSILSRIPALKTGSPLVNQFFYGFIGLGCTTAALASLDYVQDKSMKARMVFILVLLIPCSSQLAIIATFASMVTFRVFAVYLFFCTLFTALLYFAISRLLPLSTGLTKSESIRKFSLFQTIKASFASVLDTALPLSLGSVLISTAMYFGFLDFLGAAFAPFFKSFLHLPSQAVSLFILNVLKRDFGSSALISFAGNAGGFDGIQMIVMLVMMTFAVPCFNSTILLIKQQKLPAACLIWLGSLCISVLFGKITSLVLLVCFV